MAYTKGKPAPNRGKPHSEATKKKISQSCKKAGVGKWNIGILRPAEVRKHISEGQLRYNAKLRGQGLARRDPEEGLVFI